MKGLGVKMCLLAVSVIFGHRKWPNLAKMFNNSSFSKHELFQAVSLKRMVIEIWKYDKMKGIVPFGSFYQIRPPEMVKIWPK